MTKRDFEYVALVLKTIKPLEAEGTYYDGKRAMWREVVDDLSTLFGIKNVRFDSKGFKKACGRSS